MIGASSTVQRGFFEFSGEIGCVPVCRVPIIIIKKTKQGCLFRGLSIQLFTVLIAGLDCRLLTTFSLWLDCII